LTSLRVGQTIVFDARPLGGRYDWTPDRTSPDDKSRVFLLTAASLVRDDLDASERGIEK